MGAGPRRALRASLSDLLSDAAYRAAVERHLHRAASELGRTIVVVLHDINFAGHYADRICAMKDGRVVALGGPEEIMRPDVLSDIFDTPVDVVDGPRGRVAVYY
jgi:iron complex transport system ATP-binding protein